MSLALRPIDPTIEQRRDPLGIDVTTPRFAWSLVGGGQGAVQSAWRIRVGTTPGGNDLWDSGRVAGDIQLGIAYAGKPLASRTRYHWQVQVWDGNGIASPWSDPAWFETAFLDACGFTGAWLGTRPQGDDERHPLAAARWIRPANPITTELACYRIGFTLPADARVVRARLHVLADGHDSPWSCGVWKYLSINGVRPDACGNLPRRCVMTYEVGAWLKPGDNQVAMKSWAYPDSAFIAVLVIELADGSVQRLPTGTAAWQCQARTKDGHDPVWDSTTGAWTAVTEVGAFGAGPWPTDDSRNRADRLLPALVLRHRLTISTPLARARRPPAGPARRAGAPPAGAASPLADRKGPRPDGGRFRPKPGRRRAPAPACAARHPADRAPRRGAGSRWRAVGRQPAQRPGHRRARVLG